MVRGGGAPRFRRRPIRGVQGGEAPWLGRLGKVSLVRIVKNVVVVYSSANSDAIYWEILTTFTGGKLQAVCQKWSKLVASTKVTMYVGATF